MRVPRTLFLLLVLGNLLLFAWGRGYLGVAPPQGEAGRLAAQIRPDSLRIVGKGAAAEGQAALACRALGRLERAAADRLVALLAARDARLGVSLRAVNEPKSWWVHVPPLANASQAEKKSAELAGLDITDLYIVRESGPSQFAISLGLFKNEQGARDFLAGLRKKGVKSARIQAREAAGDKFVVEARGGAEELERAFAGLPEEFAGLDRTECAAARP